MMNAHMPYMPMFLHAPIQYANMKFMPNPYFGAFNMLAMPIQNDNMNHVFVNQFPVNSTIVGSSNSALLPKVKKHNSEDEVFSKSSKSKENNASTPKEVSKKTGPKTAWVPKST